MANREGLPCVLSILSILLDLLLITLKERFLQFVYGVTSTYRNGQGLPCVPNSVYDWMNRMKLNQVKIKKGFKLVGTDQRNSHSPILQKS